MVERDGCRVGCNGLLQNGPNWRLNGLLPAALGLEFAEFVDRFVVRALDCGFVAAQAIKGLGVVVKRFGEGLLGVDGYHLGFAAEMPGSWFEVGHETVIAGC